MRVPDPMPWLADDALGWPRPARWILWSLCPLAVIGAAWQRLGVMPAWAIVVAAVIGLAPSFVLQMPRVVGGACAIVAVVLFMWWPVPADVAPFVLVMAALEAGARSPLVSAGLVAAVYASVPIVFDLAGRYEGALNWVAGILLGWFAGAAFRAQLELLDKLAAAQQSLADQAVADERRRIAHDLHDVIAHSLAVTMLHVTGARLAIQEGENDEAIAALVEAERQGRASLADVRQTVGLLADSDVGESANPSPPTAARLPELVGEFRAAGLGVDLDVAGDLGEVSHGTGLSMYRIVQESLTNVVKHAPASRASVSVSVDDGAVRLAVRNGPVAAVAVTPATANGAGGLGLSSMRQRATVLAGSFSAGPEGDGWVVQAVLPQ